MFLLTVCCTICSILARQKLIRINTYIYIQVYIYIMYYDVSHFLNLYLIAKTEGCQICSINLTILV